MSGEELTLRKTSSVEIIKRTFSTGPSRDVRRGNQTIRRNCLEFVSFLRKEGYDAFVRLEEAKRLFQELFGPKDRTTLKAYFGVQPGRSERVIDRMAKYATGTTSQKKIKLTQVIEKKIGYLEFLKLATFETLPGAKGKSTWYMFLNNETSVVPEIAKSSTSVSEACVVSNDDFSLTPNDEREAPARPVTTSTEALRLQRRESVIGCERNRLSESNQQLGTEPETWLTPTQKAVLEERDRKRLQILDENLLPQLEKSVKKQA